MQINDKISELMNILNENIWKSKKIFFKCFNVTIK